MDNENEKTNETEQELKGLNFLTKLCYSCIDRSELDYQEKRNLLFAVYSFRCLFDNTELHRVSKVLYKYGCSFVTRDSDAKEYEHTYEVEDNNGKKATKFDAGSPLWQARVKAGLIKGDNAILPQKPTLYEMVLSILRLNTATAELKALWLVYFPYVFMIGAPIEYDLYDELKAVVSTAEVFSVANESHYADNVCCSIEELSGEHPYQSAM